MQVEKTILLEKQYLYIKASKGFKLRGTSTEVIPTNTGFYRFLVSNVADALGNSYVTVIYESDDLSFEAYTTDLFLEEIQNTIVVAIENIETELQNNFDRNHDDITELSEGLSGALQLLNTNLDSIKETVLKSGSLFDFSRVDGVKIVNGGSTSGFFTAFPDAQNLEIGDDIIIALYESSNTRLDNINVEGFNGNGLDTKQFLYVSSDGAVGVLSSSRNTRGLYAPCVVKFIRIA